MTITEFKKHASELLKREPMHSTLQTIKQDAPLLTKLQREAIILLHGGEKWDTVSYYVNLSPFLMKAWLENEDFCKMLDKYAPELTGSMDSMTFTRKEELQFATAELIKRGFMTTEAIAEELGSEHNAPSWAKYGMMVREKKKVGLETVDVWKANPLISDLKALVELQAKLSGVMESSEEDLLNQVKEIVIRPIFEKPKN